MHTLALYSIKGGVGKTASAVNLAYLASLTGGRVLLWDLDPQGASSFYLRVRPRMKGGRKGLMSRKPELARRVKATEFRHLELLPADLRLRKLDVALSDAPRSHLRKLVRAFESSHDYVFLDCPPGISLVAENVFGAADVLLVPLIPTTLSLRTFDTLREFLAKHEVRCRLWPFFTLVDRRKTMHREIVEGFAASYPDTLVSTIPSSSDVERMGELQAPLPAYAGERPAVVSYRSLWQEIQLRLG